MQKTQMVFSVVCRMCHFHIIHTVYYLYTIYSGLFDDLLVQFFKLMSHGFTTLDLSAF